MMNQTFYTVEQVAARYNVSPRTITRWIKSGLLPGSRKQNPMGLRSPYQIPQSAIDHYEELLAASSN